MKPYPLKLRPVLKQTIWGGRRLGEHLGKPIGSQSDYAESWEVVDHGDDQSVVENGPLAGQTLQAVICDHRAWLLGETSNSDAFPLLLKYLDCNRVLSVQVHPSDSYALRMSPPDLGKTEAWYIVAAEPGSRIYAGLQAGIDRAALQQAIDDGATEEVLHAFEPNPGDVVFIPAGTVHALGAGLLVAEIQQSSNTTFRLFDWNRVDADGNGRPLHLQQGIDVTDFQTGPIKPRTMRPSTPGWQEMVRCDKFVLQLMQTGVGSIAGDAKFHIVTVPRGKANLRVGEEVLSLSTGDSLLLPAAMPLCHVEPGAESTVMGMHLPD